MNYHMTYSIIKKDVFFFPAGIDLIASFYGCLYAGCIPVTVRPPHPQNLPATLPTVRMIIDVSLTILCMSSIYDFTEC